MEPEDSRPCSKQLAIDAHPEVHKSSINSSSSTPFQSDPPSTALHSRLDVSGGLFKSGFLIKILYTVPMYPVIVACPTIPNLLDWIVVIRYGKYYKL
jgi:hypothetical protein